MPSESENRLDAVRDALRGPMERFHSALATTIEQVRHALADARPADAAGSSSQAAELGKFAEGRIASGRFTALLSKTRRVDASVADVMARALQVLSELARRHEELCQIAVGPGGSLRATVAAGLAEIGRAFGATRVYELARAGRYEEAQHGRWLQSFPYGRWTAGERRMAPPLVATLEGADLRAAALSQFLDGAQKIVLVVRGGGPVAPLAPLVTPGVYVLQTADAAQLEGFADQPGPGIAALLGDGAAQFCHDPAGGSRSWDRLTVVSWPASAPRKTVGPISPAQEQDMLRHLEELARPPEVSVTVGAPGPSPTATIAATVGTTLETVRETGATAVATPPAPAAATVASGGSPAEKLAAWLLEQADLTGLG